MKRMLCLLLSVVLLLPIFGCAEEGPEPSVSYTEPKLVPESMKAERLTVEEGNYDRTNRTSATGFIEVASGYYILDSRDGLIYYADKTDMSNWVLFCNAPNCRHEDNRACTATLDDISLFNDGLNDRLFFLADIRGDYSYLCPEYNEASGTMLCSMALDGTDIRVEYICDDAVLRSGGTITNTMFPDGYATGLIRLNTDGTYSGELYWIDSTNGAKQVLQIDGLEGFSTLMYTMTASRRFAMRGDNAVVTTCIDGTLDNYLCIMYNGEMKTVDVSGMWAFGSYLSGNVLRCFKPNDGYYDIDLLTGEETKLADAQLENSNARILLPNCIIESTLQYNNQDPNLAEKRAQVETHSLRFFNGQEWYDVVLPEEILNMPDSEYLSVEAVTTDGIRFSADVNGEFCFYRMALDAEEYKLEYCGTFNKS